MKVRTGFVSNSSSSSFCIYGAFFERGEVDFSELGAVNTKVKDDEDDEYEDEDDEEYDDDDYESWEKRASKCGLEYHNFDGCDGHYVGISWSSVGDDETGKQFKERVQKAITEFAGKPVECDTLEEAFYS